MKPNHIAILALAGLISTSISTKHAAAQATMTNVDDPHAHETKAQRDTRMKWWREARFGMFVHWGLYAVPGGFWNGKPVGGRAVNTQGYGEWIMHNAEIPVADYATLAPQFNPSKFNADAWAQAAKDAGMKYLIFTAKHHDGFAMFHTAASPFNIFDDTPFHRDPVAELVAACRKKGIKFGIYYSQSQDWHHPGGAAWDGHWDKAQDGDYDKYLREIAVPQVRELLTKYGPISCFWFDTDTDMTPERAAPFVESLKLQPNIIYNNRLGGGFSGDTETPEQHVPATGFKGRDWESCMTINTTWGYRSDDFDFKSTEDLTRNLIDIASKGGNYLLNVGPDAQGIIPEPEVSRLKQMGAWLKVNGQSIYGAQASPFKRLPFEGRATVKGNTLYLHVFSWPENGLTLPGLQTPVKNAKALATGQKLTVSKNTDGTVTISRPSKLDPISTTIALNLAGPPAVTETAAVVTPGADGAFNLGAASAAPVGDTIALQGAGDSANLGYWTEAGDAAEWKISVPANAGGAYQAALEYSCEPGTEGAAYSLRLDGLETGITGSIAATSGWSDFQTVPLPGTLTLTPGAHTLRITPTSKPGFAVMNLKRIKLSKG
ncbi:MAG: alpha-L-fucosidase [Capsulimonas sp.]|uniref:alpha-L-fucosidase n=1 Tax=Capsulimonas sp. TaxID=2494211 RepID=UPI003266898A